MKGVIIGTDYLEKDDSVKILEINTNTSIANLGADLLDYDSFFSYMVQNDIDELHFIYTTGDSHYPKGTSFRFEDILKEKCEENNITYFKYVLPTNSVTVPYIEDTPNKFILRQSYDTTALIDETYCADKFGFVDLMKDTNLIPKTYITDDEFSCDTLDSIVDSNSVYPNITLKKRYPAYNADIYPKLYELDSLEALESLKQNSETDDLIQEFIYDEANIVDNRWTIIRGIDIVFGSNLDVINLGAYKTSTAVDLDFCGNEFEGDSNIYNKKTRFKWITKQSNASFDIEYHLDSESDIVMSDNTLSNISQLQTGSIVKSFDFQDINGVSTSGTGSTALAWDSTFEQTQETFELTNTTVVNKLVDSVSALFVKVTLENGVTWVDSPYSTIYVEENDSTKMTWLTINGLYIGDKVVVYNHTTNELEKFAVTDLDIEYHEQMIYEIDVEEADVFLTNIDSQYSYYLLMHNQCWGCQSPWWGGNPYNCGTWSCASFCSGCGGGGGKEKIA